MDMDCPELVSGNALETVVFDVSMRCLIGSRQVINVVVCGHEYPGGVRLIFLPRRLFLHLTVLDRLPASFLNIKRRGETKE